MIEEQKIENYISLNEAAEDCEYSHDYLRLRARQGKLKAVKQGRNWVTKKEWLDEYLAKVEDYNNDLEIKKIAKEKAAQVINSNNSKIKKGAKLLDFKLAVSRLSYGLIAVLVLILLLAGLLFGASILEDLNIKAPASLSSVINFLSAFYKSAFIDLFSPKPTMIVQNSNGYSFLKQEIETLKKEGIIAKELIKEIEVSKVIKIEEIEKTIKQYVQIDDLELAIFKSQLEDLDSWKTDISSKIKLYPTNNSLPNAPIYISSPSGIQVGGHGSFVSLGVQGPTTADTLGIRGAVYLGSDPSLSSDQLTVGMEATFEQLATFEQGLTNGVGIGDSSADYPLEVLAVTTQFAITNTDETSYTEFYVDSSGDLNIKPSGGNVTINDAYTLPSASPSNDQILKYDLGTGLVAWEIDAGGTPGGSNNQIQFNNSGSLGGAAQFYYDESNDHIGIGDATPDYIVEILDTTTQLTLTNVDGTNYTEFFVNSSGDLEIAPSGGNVSFGGTTGSYTFPSNVPSDNQILKYNAVTGLLVWEADVGAGGGFDSTAIHDTTWSDGTNATNTWTFDVSGTDHTMIAGNGLMSFSNNVTVSQILTTTTLQIGSEYALPSEDGTANYVLKTNGSGDLRWAEDTDTNTTYTDGTNLTLVGTTFNVDDSFIKLVGDTTGAMTEDLNLDDNTLVIDYDADKVGIGIATPNTKLEVLDTSTQLTLTYTDGSVYTEFNTDPNGDLRIYPSGGDLVISGNVLPGVDDTYDLGATNKRWKDLYLGPTSIHIGTSASDEYTISYDTVNQRLQLTGTGGFKPNGNIAMADDQWMGLSSSAGRIEFDSTPSPDTISFLSAYVGINDSSADYRLEVLDTTTQFTITNVDTSIYTEFGVDSSGNLRIEPSGTTVSLGTANLLTSGNITASNIQGANISGTWTGAEITDSYVADNITASSYLPLSGGTVSGNLVVSQILTTTTLQIGSEYNLPSEDGTTNYILRTNGTGKVYWSQDTDTTYTGGTNLTLSGTQFNVDDSFIKLVGDTTGSMNEDLNLDNNTLVIDYDADNVGIGEAVPEYKLEVLDTSTQLLLSYSDGTDSAFYVDTNGDLIIEPSGNNVIFAVSSGSYTFPGTAPADNQIMKYDVGTGLIAWEADAGGAFDSTVVHDTTWSDGSNATNTWTFAVTGTDHTMTAGDGLMTFSNKVGIGDTTPDYKLEVLDTATQFAITNVDATNWTEFYVDGSGNLNIDASGGTTYVHGALSINDIYTFPTGDGSSSQFLQTDGSGNLSWATSSGSGDVTDVGDCSDGACFGGAATGGTQLTFYNGGGNGVLSYNGAFNFDKNVGINDSGADYKLEVLDTSTQFTITNVDDTTYAEFFVDSNGDLTIEPSGGNIVFAVTAGSYTFPSGAPADNQILKYNAGTGLIAWEADAGGAFDSTVVHDTTWSDGTNATNTWTFNVTGTNHTMTAGDGLMAFSNKVGIGDPTPDYTLEVLDTTTQLTLTNVDATTWTEFYVDSSGNLNIDASGGTTYVHGALSINDIYSFPTDDGSSSQFLQTDGSGNLSWATSSGSGDVTDVGDCSDGACFGGAATGGTQLTFYNGGGNGILSYNGDFNFDKQVGINDSSADYRLEVLDTTTQLALTNVDTSVYTEFNTDPNGDLIIEPSGNNVIFAVNSGSYTFPSTTPDDNQIMKYDAGTGLIAWEADAGGAFDSTVVHDTIWSDGSNATNTWTFNVTGTDHTMIAGDGLMAFSNKVGVGDSTPDYQLEVLTTTTQFSITNVDDTTYTEFNTDPNGDLRIYPTGGDILLGSANLITSGAVNGGTFSGTYSGFTSGSIIFANGSGNLTQDNTNFYWDDSQDRLSIGGDTTPDYALEIIDTATQFTLAYTDASQWTEFYVDSSGNLNVDASGGTTYMHGILSINGAYALPVSDGTNGQYMQTDGTGNLTWSTVSAGSTDKISELNSEVEVVDLGTGYIEFIIDGTEIARIDPNGFGINDTSPDYKLEVLDTSTQFTVTNVDTSVYTEFNTDPNGDLRIYPTGGDILLGSANLITSGAVNGGTFSGTYSGFTSGSVIFANGSGNLTQDNTNFYWDDSQDRLSIGGDTTPDFPLEIISTNTHQLALAYNDDTAQASFYVNSSGNLEIHPTGLGIIFPNGITFSSANEGDIQFFDGSASSENYEIEIYGYITAITGPSFAALNLDDANDEFLINVADGKAGTTLNAAIKLDDNAGSSVFRIRDSGGTEVFYVDSDGVIKMVYDTTGTILDANGEMAVGYVASTNRIYFYSNGGIHYVDATAGFGIPDWETIDPVTGEPIEVGNFVLGVVEKERSDGSLHGLWVNWETVEQESWKKLFDQLSLDESGDVITTTSESTELVVEPTLFSRFIGSVRNALASMKEIVVEKIIAVFVKVKVAEIDRFQMIDQKTGEKYCTWIEDGEWVKIKGECSFLEPEFKPEPVVENERAKLLEPDPAESFDPAPEEEPILETVTPSSEPILEQCDNSHLGLCNTQELCQSIGLYWYGEQCHLRPEAVIAPVPEPVLETTSSSNNPVL